MAPPTLSSLPAEIQHKIIKNLNYPDLARLRMIGKYFRDLVTKEPIGSALARLELDWIKSVRSVAQKSSSCFMNGSMVRDNLARDGYAQADIRKMQHRCPCYSCVKLVVADNFEEDVHHGNYPLELVGYAHQYTNSQRQPTAPNYGRECIDCLLERKDLLNSCPRWANLSQSRWVGCQSCKEVKKTGDDVCRRQPIAEMCDDCFKDEKARWASFNNTMEQLRDTLEQEKKDLKAKIAKTNE